MANYTADEPTLKVWLKTGRISQQQADAMRADGLVEPAGCRNGHRTRQRGGKVQTVGKRGINKNKPEDQG